MEVITIQSEAFQTLMKGIDEIKSTIFKSQTQKLSEQWLDIADTCKFLHISKRTLQNYRDQGILPFSQIGGKIYFKSLDLESHLTKHYHKSFKN